jgi:hypothetical protein
MKVRGSRSGACDGSGASPGVGEAGGGEKEREGGYER